MSEIIIETLRARIEHNVTQLQAGHTAFSPREVFENQVVIMQALLALLERKELRVEQSIPSRKRW